MWGGGVTEGAWFEQRRRSGGGQWVRRGLVSTPKRERKARVRCARVAVAVSASERRRHDVREEVVADCSGLHHRAVLDRELEVRSVVLSIQHHVRVLGIHAWGGRGGVSESGELV